MITFHTSLGDIKIKLHTDKTPVTAENFLNYAKTKFYENTIFHRVIPGFVIQGGGFEPGMSQKDTNAPIENEGASGGSNLRGTLSMARTGDPHSASSQFFINLADNLFLDYKSSTPDGFGYCVFGEVTEGMDIVDKIAKSETTTVYGHQDVPRDEIIIEKVSIDE